MTDNKKNLSKSEENVRSSSTSTTKIVSTVYLPDYIFFSLKARSRYENIDISSIFNILIDLFVNSTLSFFEFKGLVTSLFNISYNPNLQVEEKATSKQTLTMNFDKENYNKLKLYVEKNKEKEYGISFSAICVQLADLLSLSNVYLHDFVNKTSDGLINFKKSNKKTR